MFGRKKVVFLGLLCGGLSIGAFAQTIDKSKSLQLTGISGITAYFAKAYTPTGTIAASFPNIDNGSIPTST